MEQPPVHPTTNPITQPINQEKPVDIPPKPEKKPTKWLVIVLVLLFLSALGITGYFAYQNNQLKKNQKTISPKPYPINAKPSTSPITYPTPTPITNPTENNNFPEIPGAYLKCKVEGATSSKLFIEIKFEDSHYDFEYEKDLENNEGLIGLGLPPVKTYAEAHITAISDDGRKSETFIINNKVYWDKVAKTNKEYALEHTFIIP